MPIIYRPDVLGDTAAQFLTDKSYKDAVKHEEEKAKRKKQQAQTAQIGGALATAGLAAVAAPALGLAGAPAGIDAATLAYSPATTGLLGSGGAVNLAGYLTAANVGAQLGGQIANENYAGAIGTAAGAANTAWQAMQDQKVYGFQPSAEGRATMARLAAQAGTTIDDLENRARQGGGTVAQQLGLAQAAADDREIETARLGTAARVIGEQEGYDALDLLNNDIESFGPQYESVPDDSAFAQAQDARARIESDLVSGNITREEAAGKAQSVRQMVAKAKTGRKQRKGPTVVNKATGAEYGPSEMWEQDGVIYRTAFDSKGNLQAEKVAGEYRKKKAWEEQPPGPQREAAKLQDLHANMATDASGQKFIQNDKGAWEPYKDPDNEALNKYLHEAALTITKETGVAPTAEELVAMEDAWTGRAQLRKDREELAAQITSFAQSSEPVTVEGAAAMVLQANEVFGEAMPRGVRNSLNAIGMRAAEAEVAAAIQQQAVQAAAAPAPMGSAASAEERGRAAAKAVKNLPETAAKVATKAAEASTVPGRGVVKPAVEGAIGFVNEMLGFRSRFPTREEAFAEAQIRNIEAGIDDAVIVFDAEGKTGIWTKGELTPAKVAELKSRGFTIPGIEGG